METPEGIEASTMADWVAPLFELPAVLPQSVWSGHIPFLFLLFHTLRPRTFVELGVLNGASYFAGCEASVRFGTGSTCWGVDTWRGDAHSGHYNGTALFEHLASFNANRYPSSTLMRATFDDAAEHFENESIDLLHIDGLHTYEAVSHDFATWRPRLSDRSVVLFHDTIVREADFGVWKLWAELENSGEYRSFEFYHSFGLGVLLVGDHSGSRLAEFMDYVESARKHAELVRVVCEVAGATLASRLERRDKLGVQDRPVPESPPASVRPITKLGRNDPCHCGSGKKFKLCHGRVL